MDSILLVAVSFCGAVLTWIILRRVYLFFDRKIKG